MNKHILSFFIAVLAILPAIGQASIKCWTNSDGIRECGNVVPPEYAQKGHEEVSDTGVVIDKVERAKTEEELKAEAEKKKKEEELAKKEAEQDKLDRILLDTYSVEDEIIMTRDGKINILQTEIKITRKNIDNAKHTLQEYRKSAANLERAGKPVPQSLQDNIQSVKTQISNYEDFIQKKQQEQDAVRAEYEHKLERFRVLTGKKPASHDSSDTSAGGSGENTTSQ
jgi:hypothetical protein